MFSEALVRALSLENTHPQNKTHLSLYDLKHPILDMLEILAGKSAPKPEVHSPDQSDGDVASIPFFPNLRNNKKPAVGTTLLTYEHTGGHVSTIAWSPDGKRLASAGDDATVRIWEATTGKTFLVLRGHSSYVDTIAWSPDGRLLASRVRGSMVWVWEAITGKLLHSYEGHSLTLWAMAWSPDGRLLASGGNDSTVQVWEATTGRLLCRCENTAGLHFMTIAWSPNGRLLALAGQDNSVQVWEVESGKILFTYRGHLTHVYFVGWSSDGERIASAAHEVHIWQAPQ